jgi:hypothetical protein
MLVEVLARRDHVPLRNRNMIRLSFIDEPAFTPYRVRGGLSPGYEPSFRAAQVPRGADARLATSSRRARAQWSP